MEAGRQLTGRVDRDPGAWAIGTHDVDHSCRMFCVLGVAAGPVADVIVRSRATCLTPGQPFCRSQLTPFARCEAAAVRDELQRSSAVACPTQDIVLAGTSSCKFTSKFPKSWEPITNNS
ncbi:hypothetical protein LCGC14_1914880 [marine sediment metagenome]|uniref:Uncharacterized protein n=1 Tax=marine sediment metagenome TaxID=412755 RepID=A0A0F9I6J6_9ZZZZ